MRPGTLPLLGAAVIAVPVDVLYVSIIVSQHERGVLLLVWVTAVATYIGGGGVLAVLAALGSWHRPYVAAAAGGALLFIGGIALLTIGAPLVVASGLAFIGMSRAGRAERYSAATAFAVAAVVILIGTGGLLATASLR